MSTPNSPSIAPPESICVLRLSAIGDVCHTVPVVRALQRRWPAARLTWIIGSTEASLAGDLPGVEFITYDKDGGLAAWRALRAALHGRRFDWLLHMQASLRACLVSTAISARARLGFDRARARNFQWLFTDRRIEARAGEHVMEGLLGFAEVLDAPREPLLWEIPLDAATRGFAREVIPPGGAALLISPCSSQRARNFRDWSRERYAALVDHAAARGLQTVLTGGPTELEREYARQITALAKSKPVDLVGRTSLKQLLAVIARARAVVAPDSGPVHIATAVRTPVIGLYATSNPARTGPYFSRRWTVNRYPDAVRLHLGLAPDAVRWGRRVRAPDAMDLIGLDEVTAKLDELLADRDELQRWQAAVS